MKTLERIAGRNKSYFTSLTGTRFKGTLYPLRDGALPSNTFIQARRLLRVKRKEPVRSGDTVRDENGRYFLLADHDTSAQSRTFAAIELTTFATWRRVGSSTHPVTHQPMAGSLQDRGRIWCAIEDYARGSGSLDSGLQVPVNRVRVLTGADIQLSDIVDDRTVKRLILTMGIRIGEVE